MSALPDILLFAAEAAVGSTVLPLGAWLLARADRRCAGRRRLIWAMTFVILLALPLLAALSPSLTVITLTAAPAPSAPAAAVEPAGPSPTPIILLAGPLVWSCGVLWVLIRGLGGLIHLQRLRRRSTPAPRDRLPLPLPPGCSVRVSPDCPGPMTWGVARPVILLPEQAFDWPRARLEAALRHELAHVRHGDCLAQTLALAACALYWPNPLVWRAARALRDAAEAAADDAVIAAGVRPSDYAAQLVDLAREWRDRRGPVLDLAMAAPPILTERVQSILSPEALRTGATPMDLFKLALVRGVAAAALTLARPSIAEIAPPAPPSAPVVPQTQQAAPAPAAPAKAAASAPAIRSRAHNPVQQIEAAGDKQTAEQTIQLAQQDVPATPAAVAPPAPLAPRPGWGAPVWIPGPGTNTPPPGAGASLTPEQQAELNRKLAEIGPKISKALADAHISEQVAKGLAAAAPEIDAAVAKQLAELNVTIQKALADAHISEQVAKSLAAAKPQIDAAIAEAKKQAERARDERPPAPPAPN